MTAAPSPELLWDSLLASYLEAAPRARHRASRARAVEVAVRAVDAVAGLARWCGVGPDEVTSRQIAHWLERPGPRPYSARSERLAVMSVFDYGTAAEILPAHPLEALPEWAEMLDQFAATHRGGASSHRSIHSHRTRVLRFARWAGVAPAAVDREMIRRYLAAAGWSDHTRTAARTSLRLVLGAAADSGLLPDNPARLLPVDATSAHRPYEQLATAAAAAFDHGCKLLRVDAAALAPHPCWDWAEATGRPYASGKSSGGRLTPDLLAEWQAAGSPVVTFLDDPVRAAWDRLLVAYAAAAAAGGRTSSTIHARYEHLRTFARWAAVAPAGVDEPMLVRYLGNPDWKPDTRKGVRSSLRAAFRFAFKAGLIAADPSAELEGVRVPGSSPRPTPEAALSASLAGVHPRTRLMILLGALAGLRRAEIAGLSVDAITEDGLRIIGKGGKVRMVPIHQMLGPEIIAYLANTGIRAGYLFPSRASDSHLTPRWVGKTLARALPDQWTGHSLRHRFSSRSYAGCFDIRALQELLGHESPATTARYVAVPNTALVNAVAAVPPVAGMGAPPCDAPPSDAPPSDAPDTEARSGLPPATTGYPGDVDDPWAEWAAQSARG